MRAQTTTVGVTGLVAGKNVVSFAVLLGCLVREAERGYLCVQATGCQKQKRLS